MLEAAAGEERPGLEKRLDHRLVGVSLVTLVGDDAKALEARGFEGEGAVLVDRIGDARVDAAPGEPAAVRRPELEVLPAMAGRRVDEAGSGLVGDVVALEQRDDKAIAVGVERMGAEHLRQSVPVDWAEEFVAPDSGGVEDAVRERLREDVG